MAESNGSFAEIGVCALNADMFEFGLYVSQVLRELYHTIAIMAVFPLLPFFVDYAAHDKLLEKGDQVSPIPDWV
jgi:hypothetical protein